MKRPAPEWHRHCLALRKAGYSPQAIARQLDRSITMVRWVLNEKGERERQRESVRLSRQRDTRSDGDSPHILLFKPHRYRTPKAIIDRKAISPAARAFARGEIDRAELMRRITP